MCGLLESSQMLNVTASSQLTLQKEAGSLLGGTQIMRQLGVSFHRLSSWMVEQF